MTERSIAVQFSVDGYQEVISQFRQIRDNLNETVKETQKSLNSVGTQSLGTKQVEKACQAFVDCIKGERKAHDERTEAILDNNEAVADSYRDIAREIKKLKKISVSKLETVNPSIRSSSESDRDGGTVDVRIANSRALASDIGEEVGIQLQERTENIFSNVATAIESLQSNGIFEAFKGVITKPVNDVLTGYYEAIGQVPGNLLGKGVSDQLEERLNVSFERNGKQLVNVIANGLDKIKAPFVKIRETFEETLINGLSRATKIALDNIRKGGSFSDLARELGKDFRQNLQEGVKNGFKSGLEKAKPDLKAFTDNLKKQLGLALSPGEIVRRRRERILKERAKGLVSESRERLQQDKQTQKGLSNIPETAENIVLVPGGFAGSRKGRSGKSIFIPDLEVHDDPRNHYIESPNPNTDVIDKSDPDQSEQNVIEMFRNVALQGYNQDAIDLAARALEAKQRKPDAKVTLAGFSAGGFLSEEALRIIEEVEGTTEGFQATSFGTPDLPGSVSPKSAEVQKILGANDDVFDIDQLKELVKDIEERFGINPMPKLSREKQNIPGVQDHNAFEYVANSEDVRNAVYGEESFSDELVEAYQAQAAISPLVRDLRSQIAQVEKTLEQKTAEARDIASQVQAGELEKSEGMQRVTELEQEIQEIYKTSEPLYKEAASLEEDFSKIKDVQYGLQQEIFKKFNQGSSSQESKQDEQEVASVLSEAVQESQQELNQYLESLKGILTEVQEIKGILQRSPSVDEELDPWTGQPWKAQSQLDQKPFNLDSNDSIDPWTGEVRSTDVNLDADNVKVSRPNTFQSEDEVSQESGFRLKLNEIAETVNAIYALLRGRGGSAEPPTQPTEPTPNQPNTGGEAAPPETKQPNPPQDNPPDIDTELQRMSESVIQRRPPGLVSDVEDKLLELSVAVDKATANEILESIRNLFQQAYQDFSAALKENNKDRAQALAITISRASEYAKQQLDEAFEEAKRQFSSGLMEFNSVPKNVERTQKQVEKTESLTQRQAKNADISLEDDAETVANQYITYLNDLTEQASKSAKEQIRTLKPNYDEMTIEGKREYAQNFIEDIRPEARRFREAVNSGNVELAREIGESLLTQAATVREMYRELAEQVDDFALKRSLQGKASQMAALQKEIRQGQPNQTKQGRVSEGLTQIVDRQLQEYPEQAARIGREIAEGLEKGINQGRDRAKDAGQNLGQSAQEGAEDELDISSPSRVFMRIGKQVVDGFLKGFHSVRDRLSEIPEQVGATTSEANEQMSNLGAEEEAEGGAEGIVDTITAQFDDMSEGIIERLGNVNGDLATFARSIKNNIFDLLLGFLELGVLFELGQRVSEFGKLALEAASNLESLKISFIETVGSIEKGQEELRKASEIAQEYGIALNVAREAALGLEAATKGTTLEGEQADQIQEAFSRIAVERGLGSGAQKRVFTALEQIVSKGKLQAEEVRQQLGDTLPGFQQLVASALGVDSAQLQEMMENGELLAEDVLPKIAAQINATASTAQTSTLNKELTEFNNSMTKILETVGGATLGPVRATLNAINKGLSGIADNVGAIGKAIPAIVVALSQRFIGRLLALMAQLPPAPSILKSIASVILQRLIPAITKMLGKFVLIQAAIESVINLFNVWNDLQVKEVSDRVDEVADSVDRVKQALREANDELDKFSKNKPQSASDLRSDEDFLGLGQRLGIGNLNLDTLIRGPLGFTTKAEAEQNQISVQVGNLSTEINELLSKQQESLQKATELEAIDAELRELRSRRLATEDSSQQERITEQEKALQEERDKILIATSAYGESLQRGVQNIKRISKFLDQEFANDQITQPEYERLTEILDTLSEELEESSDEFQDEMSDVTDSIDAFGEQLKRINAQLRAFRENQALSQAEQSSRIVNRGLEEGLGEEEIQQELDNLELRGAQEYASQLRTALQGVNDLLNREAFQPARQRIDEYFQNRNLPMTSEGLEEMLDQNRDPLEQSVIEGLIRQRELRQELADQEKQVANQLLGLRSEAEGVGESLKGFIENLRKELRSVQASIEQLQLDLGFQEISRRLKNALSPGADSFVADVSSQVQGWFDELSSIAKEFPQLNLEEFELIDREKTLREELQGFKDDVADAASAVETFTQALQGGTSTSPASTEYKGDFSDSSESPEEIVEEEEEEEIEESSARSRLSAHRLPETRIDAPEQKMKFGPAMQEIWRTAKEAFTFSSDKNLEALEEFQEQTAQDDKDTYKFLDNWAESLNKTTRFIFDSIGEWFGGSSSSGSAPPAERSQGEAKPPSDEPQGLIEKIKNGAGEIIEQIWRKPGDQSQLQKGVLVASADITQMRGLLAQMQSTPKLTSPTPEVGFEWQSNPKAGQPGQPNNLGAPRGDNRGGSHRGVDIYAPLGSPVVAPQSGQVVYAKEGGTRYNSPVHGQDSNLEKPGIQPQHSVKIKLDEPIQLSDGRVIRQIYMTHLSKIAEGLRAGDRVQAGQKLGEVGFANEYHLHMGLFQNSGESGALLSDEIIDLYEKGVIDNAIGNRTDHSNRQRLTSPESLPPVPEIGESNEQRIQQQRLTSPESLPPVPEIGESNEQRIQQAEQLTEQVTETQRQELELKKQQAVKDLQNFITDLEERGVVRVDDIISQGVEESTNQLNSLKREYQGLTQEFQRPDAGNDLERNLEKVERQFKEQREAFEQQREELQNQLTNIAKFQGAIAKIEQQFTGLIEQARQADIPTEPFEQVLVSVQKVGENLEAEVPQIEGQINQISNLLDQLPEDRESAIEFTTQEGELAIAQQELKLREERLNLEAQIKNQRADFLENAGYQFEAAAMRQQVAIKQKELETEQKINQIRQEHGYSEEAEDLISQVERLNELELEAIDQKFKNLGQTIAEIGKNQLEDFFNDIFTNVSSVGEAFRSLVTGILKGIAQIAAKRAAASLFSFIGFKDGGTVGGFKDGGEVDDDTTNALTQTFPSFKRGKKKEGAGAKLAFFTPGEEVLSLKEGEAQRYQALKQKLGRNPLKHIYAGEFAMGGTVGLENNLLRKMPPTDTRISLDEVRGSRDRGGNRTVTIENYITTPDAESFRRSEGQIAREQQEQLRRYEKRYG